MDPSSTETQTMTSDLQGNLQVNHDETHEGQLLEQRYRGCSQLVSLAAAVASLSGLILGYEMGVTSGVLLQLRGALSLSCREQELLVSSLLLGALLVCLASGPLLDRYGRRASMLLSAGLVAAGSVPLVAVTSLTALTLGRAVVGAGTALSGTAACLYIAEIAPRERRGALVTLYELAVVLGVLAGFGCGYAFGALPYGWKYAFGLAIPPALLQVAALLLLPPSPRFLVARGRPEQAMAVLLRLRGGAKEDVAAELRDIEAALKEESQHGFRELFSGKANLRSRLLTGIALVFLQQVTGQPNVLSYASPLLRSVGFDSDAAAALASTGFGAIKVAGTVPAVLLVDRLGPKSFLCVGAVTMCMSLTTLGVVTAQSHTHLTSLCQSPASDSGPNHTHHHRGWASNATTTVENDGDNRTSAFLGRWNGSDSVKERERSMGWVGAQRTGGDGDGTAESGGARTRVEVSQSLKWVSLISLLVYVAAFSISLGPMVYVVLSEIFPTGVRGKAVSVVSAVNWATNLLMSMTFLTVTEKMGVPNVMFLYAAMSFVLLVFVILCIPETKGRTLEQISKELAKKKHFEVRFCKGIRNLFSSTSSTDTVHNALPTETITSHPSEKASC